MSAAPESKSVLCVDDEPKVLDGLKLTLRRGFAVSVATSGADGLAILERMAGAAVVISDMRMPGMDGATFLTKVREHWPESTRLLLTGETGRDAAVLAVNEGQIFRFLTKPCTPANLLSAVEAAVRQHELVIAEKRLLQETVLGSIRALVDVLAIVNPIAFGRGGRIKRLAVELAAASGLAPSWELEAAALLSQLGYVSLPAELVEKAVIGAPLNAEEAHMVSEAPRVTQQLLGRIPRLAEVEAIMTHALRPRLAKTPAPPRVARYSAVLAIALEFDALVSRGEDAATAIATLRARSDAKSAPLLSHLAALQNTVDAQTQVREVRLCDVVPGMILMDDLRTDLGTLLVSKGYEVTENFIHRMRNFGAGLLAEKVRVSRPALPSTSPAQEGKD